MADTVPYTKAELDGARAFGGDWISSHGIPESWGNADDVVLNYKNFRAQGESHEQAQQHAIDALGWNKAPEAPATPAAPPASGSSGSAPAAPSSAPPSFDIPPPPTGARVPSRDLGTGVMVPGYVPDTPVFTPPTYTPPPAFSYPDLEEATPFTYDDYTPTTAADLEADPSYHFRVDEGLNALTNSAAARGVANTGGTLKDFINYGENAASQEFGAVDTRRIQNYKTNRGNAFDNYNLNETNRVADYGVRRGNAVDTYNTNYATQYTDPYKIAYTAAVDEFAPKMTAYQTQAQAGQHESDQSRSYDFNTWLQQYNIWRNGLNDTFDQKYKITALQ